MRCHGRCYIVIECATWLLLLLLLLLQMIMIIMILLIMSILLFVSFEEMDLLLMIVYRTGPAVIDESYIISYCIILYYVILCYIMLYYILLYITKTTTTLTPEPPYVWPIQVLVYMRNLLGWSNYINIVS